ncbi:CPBP family intramembrane glutamic endopeptidase [Brevundimonas sp. TWP2-3-4b2]|uniref:CPBP family intramembrane glutamic endopeptidase n=1 Tax=Brevundimonas sp. TWP2-3-4b2 TaxID=2804595 RepID=UPI003CF92579
MVHSRRPQLDLALAAAAESTLTARFVVTHPWRRVASFVALAAMLMTVMVFSVGVAISGIPGMRDQVGDLGPLPDSPLRLINESFQVALFALILGALAFGILAAAAMTYRRPLTDFLWPGRRFDVQHLGTGFLTMVCISVTSVPIYLAMGSEWAPPILDAQYLDRTRLTYVLVMVGGLLVAAAAEEVVCRGVLLRLTGLITRHPLVLCLINGLIFSAIHLDPDPVAFVARAVSGAVWTWAALRLGGLEFAIGAHLANNLVIALFWQPFSEAGTSRDAAWTELAPEVLSAVVMVVMIERLANRYVKGPPRLPARAAA